MHRTFGALLITLMLGFLVTPLAAETPPGKLHRIGVLRLAAPSEATMEAFRQGLRDRGYVAAQNLIIEERYAEDHLDRLPHLVADLIRLEVDVIVALGGPAARAAKQATSTIPIVIVVGDALEQGLVPNLARPGGNITGVSNINPDLSAKRLELLKEAVPWITRVAVLWCPDLAANPPQWRATHAAAQTLGVELHSLEVRATMDLEAIMSATTRTGADAMVVFDCALFSSQVERTTTLPLPAIYASSTFVRAGGLMSYGAHTLELYRRMTTYVDKILQGAQPADLPVEQPTTFELVINLKTAQALGLTIPPALLFQATEVIR